MAPTVTLLTTLAEARRAGITFELAWPEALEVAVAAADRAERGQWRKAFDATAEAWECSYARRRDPGTAALATLSDAALVA